MKTDGERVDGLEAVLLEIRRRRRRAWVLRSCGLALAVGVVALGVTRLDSSSEHPRVRTAASRPPSTNAATTATAVPAPRITGWPIPGRCAPSLLRTHPDLCGVATVDLGVKIDPEGALTVASGKSTVRTVRMTVPRASVVERSTNEPLDTLITDPSGRAVGGTVAFVGTQLLPDSTVTGTGPVPIAIAGVAFLPSPLSAQPALPPGRYLLWVVLVNDDVNPTRVARPLNVEVLS